MCITWFESAVLHQGYGQLSAFMLVFSCMTYLQCWWEKEEKRRDISLPFLMSWTLRSFFFVAAVFSVWVGRYEYWSVFSLCNVRGEVQAGVPLGLAHILHPHSPMKQLRTSVRESLHLCVPLEQVHELRMIADDCHIAARRPPVPGTSSLYRMVYLPK